MKDNDKNNDVDVDNITDLEKARQVRASRQMIKQCSEILKTLRGYGHFRAMVDEAVMYDPLLTTPLPEEKEFMRNGFIKTMERSSSEIDESNKKLIEGFEEYIRLLKEEIAEI